MQFINIFIPDSMTCIFAICCIIKVNISHFQPFRFRSVIIREEFYYICLLKHISMKRKLFYATGFVFLVFAFTSCEPNCKVCQSNTYNSSGTLLTAGTETEYCDAALVRIEATPDATVLGVTSKWVCR